MARNKKKTQREQTEINTLEDDKMEIEKLLKFTYMRSKITKLLGQNECLSPSPLEH